MQDSLEPETITAFDFLKRFPHLPMETNGNMPVKASNNAIRRWFETGSILINGQRPKATDEVTLPVWQLIFFPKNNKRRTTMQDIPQPTEK